MLRPKSWGLALVAVLLASACGRLRFESHERDGVQMAPDADSHPRDGGIGSVIDGDAATADASNVVDGGEAADGDAAAPRDAGSGTMGSDSGPSTTDSGAATDAGRDAGPPMIDAGPPEPTNWAFSDDGSNVLRHEGDIYTVSSGAYGSPNSWVGAVDGTIAASWYVCTNGWNACIRTIAEIDLGTDCDLQRLFYQVTWDGRAEYGSGATIEMSVSPDRAAWSVVDTRTVAREEATSIDVSGMGASGRYLRLAWIGAVGSTTSPSWNGWGHVREIEAWCLAP